MTPTVTAIDPGKDTGIATFRGAELYEARIIPSDHKGVMLRWTSMHIVCEIPQAYRGSGVSTQSLLTLAFRAGYLSGLLQTNRTEQYCLVKPAQWKGQIPKEIHHKQILKQLKRFELFRLEECLQDIPKSKHHNVYDAVGLGLWYLQRRLKCRSIRKDG